MERVILTTGGTGGHIFPALAVAEELRRRNPAVSILFMGGQYGQEADLAVKAGLDFVGLPVRGVLGRGFKGFLAVFGMVRALVKAYAVIRKVKPELVVGFGGYAAFAGVLAARLSGRPTAVHEQNAYPGMVNRLLGKVVDRIFLSMPDAVGAFDAKKTVLAGNPIRAAIGELYEKRREAGKACSPVESGTRAGETSFYGGVDAESPFDVRERKGKETALSSERQEESLSPEDGGNGLRPSRLLVMGGSLGARAINQAMVQTLSVFLEAGIEIWHQTGQTDYESVRTAYREAGAEYVRVEPFITDMRRAYAWADLVLCRAGGSSMAEVTAAGLPAVLVPLPQAARDHQRHNARFLEKEGGAVVLEQSLFASKAGWRQLSVSERSQDSGGDSSHKEGNPMVLAQTVLALLQDRTNLRNMAEKSLAAARPYAARDLVDGLEALLAG